jgi:hypothetical protein
MAHSLRTSTIGKTKVYRKNADLSMTCGKQLCHALFK